MPVEQGEQPFPASPQTQDGTNPSLPMSDHVDAYKAREGKKAEPKRETLHAPKAPEVAKALEPAVQPVSPQPSFKSPQNTPYKPHNT